MTCEQQGGKLKNGDFFCVLLALVLAGFIPFLFQCTYFVCREYHGTPWPNGLSWLIDTAVNSAWLSFLVGFTSGFFALGFHEIVMKFCSNRQMKVFRFVSVTLAALATSFIWTAATTLPVMELKYTDLLLAGRIWRFLSEGFVGAWTALAIFGYLCSKTTDNSSGKSGVISDSNQAGVAIGCLFRSNRSPIPIGNRSPLPV